MKTKKEILDYVVEQIKAQGGRATNGHKCQLEVDGKRCGFSLCLIDEERSILIQKKSDGFVPSMSEGEIESLLKPEFRGHSKDFWDSVQRFHDVKCNWNYDDDVTLSEQGRSFYGSILSCSAEDNLYQIA